MALTRLRLLLQIIRAMVAGEAIEDAVDQFGRFFFGAIPFGEFNGFVDGDLWRCVFAVEDFAGAQTHDRAIDHCEAVDGPIFEPLIDSGVNRNAVVDKAFKQVVCEGDCRRICRTNVFGFKARQQMAVVDKFILLKSVQQLEGHSPANRT